VRDYSTGELKHNMVAWAKAARALKLPIIVTTSARDSMWGPTFPELVAALPGVQIIDRSSVNAFDNPRVARDRSDRPQESDLRRHLARSLRSVSRHHRGRQGIWRLCRRRCVRNFSETKRQAGLLCMLQAAVIVSDYATLMVEILKDNARPEAGTVYDAMDMHAEPILVRSEGLCREAWRPFFVTGSDGPERTYIEEVNVYPAALGDSGAV
jgi:hypothetical protein